MKTTWFKFSLDCVLLVTFLLLMDPRSFYGLGFHEWAGLIIGTCFILHIVASWDFVKACTVRFFGSVKHRSRLNYVLDILLLVSMGAAIVSGLPIARTIDFSWIGFSRSSMMYWRTLHTTSSMIALLLVGVHLGLHWDWVTARVLPVTGRAGQC
jgi:hypothetical protein